MDTSPYRILLVLETVFQFHEHLGVLIVDGEGAAVSMKEVVAQRSVELVVQGVVGTQTVVDTTIGYVNVGEALQGESIVE